MNENIKKIVLCITIIFCFLFSGLTLFSMGISHYGETQREPICTFIRIFSFIILGSLVYIIYPALFFLVIYNFELGFKGFAYAFSIGFLILLFYFVVCEIIIRNEIKTGNYVLPPDPKSYSYESDEYIAHNKKTKKVKKIKKRRKQI